MWIIISHNMADALDQIFSALADPTRRQILVMLLEDDMAVTDVAEPFEISLAAVSKHLGILASAKLIQQERRGRVKWCKLDPQAMHIAWTRRIWFASLLSTAARDLLGKFPGTAALRLYNRNGTRTKGQKPHFDVIISMVRRMRGVSNKVPTE